MYVCIHVCVYELHTCMCMCIHVCVCELHTCMCVYMYVCIHVCVYTCMCVYMYVCIHVCVYELHTCTARDHIVCRSAFSAHILRYVSPYEPYAVFHTIHMQSQHNYRFGLITHTNGIMVCILIVMHLHASCRLAIWHLIRSVWCIVWNSFIGLHME